MRDHKNNNRKIIDSTPEILKSYEKRKTPSRPRIKLSEEQREALERCYLENQHPSSDRKELLEYKFNIPMKNIQIWFQNRRAKDRNNIEHKWGRMSTYPKEFIDGRYNKENHTS